MCFTAAAEAGKEGSLDVVLLKAATGRLMTDWWQIGGRSCCLFSGVNCVSQVCKVASVGAF